MSMDPRHTAPRRWRPRHFYLLLATGIALTSLALFAFAAALDIDALVRADAHIDDASWAMALLGVSLLVADVLLPVPSSGVMLANGAQFGFVLGSCLSLLGGTGATVVGYLLGRQGSAFVARFVSPDQRERAGRLLGRHGTAAIVLTRPIPVVAETVAILAGADNTLSLKRVTVAGAVGSLVPSVAYAAAGSSLATWVSGPLLFAIVVLIATAVWLVTRTVGSDEHLQPVPVATTSRAPS